PLILCAAGCAVRKDQGIVLIHGKQALLPTGRTEHRDGVGTRWLAAFFRPHPLFGEGYRSLAQRTQPARDQRSNVATGKLLRHEARGNLRELRPATCERWYVSCLVDLIA